MLLSKNLNGKNRIYLLNTSFEVYSNLEYLVYLSVIAYNLTSKNA